ncbi:MAG: substrate-binding domain-containing protein, partial [Chloroflexi bacterium]|nr:substrate-binding domain-containing protein [Chloroflexota bacterium]
SSRRMPDLVREGAVDVGIASTGTALPGLHVTPWKQLHLGLLALDPRTPSPAPIVILEGAPLVMNSSGSLRDAVETALRAHAVTPRIVAQADSLEVVRMLVGCGFGLAVAPLEVLKDDAARSGLVLAPFAEALNPLPVASFYRRMTPPLKALLELVGQH